MPLQSMTFLVWPLVAAAMTLAWPDSDAPFARKDMVLLWCGIAFLVLSLWQAETFGHRPGHAEGELLKLQLVLSAAYLQFPIRRHLCVRPEWAVAAACTLAYIPAFLVFHVGLDPMSPQVLVIVSTILAAHPVCITASRISMAIPAAWRAKT